jgi:hypothetical protein
MERAGRAAKTPMRRSGECQNRKVLDSLPKTFGGRAARVAMKTPVLIVLTTMVLGILGTLAFMNNACKSSQHNWCASTIRHQMKTG